MTRLVQNARRLQFPCVALAAAALLLGACADGPTSSETRGPGVVTGQITVDGVGRAGLRVEFNGGSLYPPQTATTGPGGTYRIELPAYPFVVSVLDASLTCPTEEITVELETEHILDLACREPRGTLSGRVFLDGAPWAGVSVDVFRSPRGSGEDLRLTTDGSGAISTVVRPGDFTVVVGADPVAECEDNPRDVTVSDMATTQVDFTCTSVTGTISGAVYLDGVPQPMVDVEIRDGGGVIVTTVITDNMGQYSAEVPPGTHRPVTSIDRGVCPLAEESEVEVQVGATVGADLGCSSLPREYEGTLSETSNTCSVPPAPPAPLPVEILIPAGADPMEYILRVGDRPEDTWVPMICDSSNRQCTGTSPEFGDGSGFTFVDTWTFDVMPADPATLQLDGSVEVDLFFPGGGVCTRYYDFEASDDGG